MVKDGVVYYTHNNYMGLPRLYTDSSMNLVWSGEFKPFGELFNENGQVSNWVRFIGQWENVETDYFYNYFRDYDPTLGRYLQSDPIGLNAGVNTYTYVLNDPINGVDPFGLSEQDVLLIESFSQTAINEMTHNKNRISNGLRNNHCRSYNNSPLCLDIEKPDVLKDCGEQTNYIIRKLNKLKEDNILDDNWEFVFRAGFGHAWGQAISSNKNDPIITFDGRANIIAIGEMCETCTGWVGGLLDNPELTGEKEF
jgi:RHS repeat-associated protein